MSKMCPLMCALLTLAVGYSLGQVLANCGSRAIINTVQVMPQRRPFCDCKSGIIKGNSDTKADLNENSILIINLFWWDKELYANRVSFMIIQRT